MLGRFLFKGDDAFKTVEKLSGGEKARMALMKFLAGGTNLLVLDEPTNHLDLASQKVVSRTRSRRTMGRFSSSRTTATSSTPS